MVYYKLILNDKRSKSDQIYPIVVRVTSNRISTTVSTGLRVHIKEWDAIIAVIKNSHLQPYRVRHTPILYFLKYQPLPLIVMISQLG
ncbi:Arm DNA-binding domain-containing protein [Pedobacter cryoconitis]|uniref:Arm DNA-binding domain-containing protein n=1 Tax=Pedobacter cryoconitis TaxID=188932 RepID=UPI003982E37B